MKSFFTSSSVIRDFHLIKRNSGTRRSDIERLFQRALQSLLKTGFMRISMPQVLSESFCIRHAALLPIVGGPLGHPVQILINPVVRSEEHTSELQSRGHLVC